MDTLRLPYLPTFCAARKRCFARRASVPARRTPHDGRYARLGAERRLSCTRQDAASRSDSRIHLLHGRCIDFLHGRCIDSTYDSGTRAIRREKWAMGSSGRFQAGASGAPAHLATLSRRRDHICRRRPAICDQLLIGAELSGSSRRDGSGVRSSLSSYSNSRNRFQKMVASAPIRARAATPDSTIMPNCFKESSPLRYAPAGIRTHDLGSGG